MAEGCECLLTSTEDDFWRPYVPASDKAARWSRQNIAPLLSQLRTKRRNSDTTLSHHAAKEVLYQRLPERRSIRLLHPLSVNKNTRMIIATLKTVELDTCGLYRALSYTWGPAKDDDDDVIAESIEHPIRYQLAVIQDPVLEFFLLNALLSGNPVGEACLKRAMCYISLEQNLSDFLVTYVEDGFNAGNEPIWIDAICINQEDEAEKASQIKLMGDIYSFAVRVIVWLGKNDHLRSKVFSMMTGIVLPKFAKRKAKDEELEKYLNQFHDIEPTDPNFWSDLGFDGFSKSEWGLIWHEYLKFIQHSRWFRRCWVGQEFCLAERIVVMCGSNVMEPSFMALSFLRPWILRLESSFESTFQLEPALQLFEFRWDIAPESKTHAYIDGRDLSDYFNPPRGPGTEPVTASTMLEYLEWTRSRETTIEADRVFSILGMTSRYNDFKTMGSWKARTDSVSTTEIFTTAATYILRNMPDLRLLSHVESQNIRRNTQLPSWVPDFSVSLQVPPILHAGTVATYNATLIGSHSAPPIQIQRHKLKVRGRRIGIVQGSLSIALLHALYVFPEESWIEKAREHLSKLFGPESASKDLEMLLSGSAFVAKTNPLDPARALILLETFKKILSDEVLFRYLLTSLLKWLLLSMLKSPTPEEPFVMLAMLVKHYKSVSDLNAGTVYRQIFHSYTETGLGYAGIGNADVQGEDSIWLLEHGRVPYILREKEGAETFSFIGECYVFGIMHGELMTPEFRDGFVPICIL